MIHLIIGAGAAGITAAKTLRELDSDAAIIMISADEFVHSRCMLHKYISAERNEKTLSFVSDHFFEENDIMWMNKTYVNHVDTASQEVELQDGTHMFYDKLLIATGANSIIPPIGQFKESKNVFGLRNLSDAQQISNLSASANRILIVGSGLVGMDAAYAFLEMHKNVTIIEMADRILPTQLDATAGKAYQKLFEQHGCKFILGKKASETIQNKDGNIEAVILDDGTKIECDLIIVAAGVCPAVACVDNTDIATERFIIVDDFLQTSDKNIYAAGDVTGLSAIWPNAMKQGQIAAYNMCGKKVQYLDQYAMKNTMNFYGLTTLSLGRGIADENDKVIICEDANNYKKAILKDGCLSHIMLQGNIDYSGIYQFLIKNKIKLHLDKTDIFHLSFADFYGIDKTGQYTYQ
ncbi:NAD(P)/FAD-dependent oxidoreductase [Lachnotalea glycerini]|uniref:NAD(P)/FAD-dependent oxidoreductase n=1 Tax=Lachnotalea glycerini TaxID=1763509 RepID=A0A371JI04_9FIRM|nr:FAD-dependent oxidoreductase [Lachnotalea glycerini]RDY32371.1 NAD(P)/FAD-dependent oxidoreductase [Lachnotalea glycerini]